MDSSKFSNNNNKYMPNINNYNCFDSHGYENLSMCELVPLGQIQAKDKYQARDIAISKWPNAVCIEIIITFKKQ